jgi:hypothetical protein
VRLASLLVCLGVTLSLAAAPVARADGVADAKDIFSRARELRVQGDCPSAIALFKKAYEIYPAGLGSLRNIAECEESLGHFASARRSWLDLKRALVTVDDKKYDGWSRDAEDAAARLAPKLATLTLDVTAVRPDGAQAAGESVQVKLNGEVVAVSLLRTPLERDPGRYVISVTAPGAATPEEQVVELTAGSSRRIALQVVVSSSPSPTPSGEGGPTPEGAVSPDTTPRTLAWVAFGVGAAGLVGTVVALAVRQSALGKISGDSRCSPSPSGDVFACSQSEQGSLQASVNTGNTASTFVNVMLPVAVVGAATGVVLLLTSRPHSPQAALVVAPGGAWAVGRF